MRQFKFLNLAIAVFAVTAVVFAAFAMFYFRDSYDQAADQVFSRASRTDVDNKSDLLTVVEVRPTNGPISAIDKISRTQDPHDDSWTTEKQSVDINEKLKELANLFEKNEANSFQSQLTSDFLADIPHSRDWTTDEIDRTLSVHRMQRNNGQQFVTNDWSIVVQRLTSSFSRPPRVKYKLFKIDSHAETIQTTAYYQSFGKTKDSIIQQNATWKCRWRLSSQNELQLQELRILDMTESILNSSNRLFSDLTRSVLSANRSFGQQVVPGIPYWSSRLSREFMTQFGHHGIAIGDVNGDGLDDLYVCDTGGLPNRLYVQQSDGTARDVSTNSGVNILEDSVSALLIDLDNDGDQDLVIATDPLIQIAENDGTGRFAICNSYYANTDSYSMCASDYDADGDLDLFICGYNARKQDPLHRGLPFPIPYQDANNGGKNYLLRNEGNFRFSDVTDKVGLDSGNSQFTLAASWCDFDDDGDQDLYVANDFGRNCLFRNDGERFTNIAEELAVEDQASGMSVSCADFDRDGLVDIYVSNMFSAAGNRVTYQHAFAKGIPSQTVDSLRRMARGNTLFKQSIAGRFQDVSEKSGTMMGRWAWGSRFIDINNDGWQDLLVANGYVTNSDTTDL